MILYLFRTLGLSAPEVETMLYRESGLLGISGVSSDMRVLLESDEPAAKLAVDYFVYRVTKEIGALAAVLGGLDGLVFTAGIGENSPEIRQRICAASAWLGIELDPAANRRAQSTHFPRRKQGLRVGRANQRRTDDRPAHRRVAGACRNPRLAGASQRGTLWP